MSPFIETLKVRDGRISNMSFHQARFERTRTDFFGYKIHPALEDEIVIPDDAKEGLFKCRVVYDGQDIEIGLQAYTPPDIKSLKVIFNDDISYGYKSADRSALTKLYDQRGTCDDILIVKKGWLTDSYFANVAFWDGSQWLTPDTPLLAGCMRASLLENGTIEEAGIRMKDLSRFSRLKLINALNDWEDAPTIPIDALSL